MTEIHTRTTALELPARSMPVDVSAGVCDPKTTADDTRLTCLSRRADMGAKTVSRATGISRFHCTSAGVDLLTEKDLKVATRAERFSKKAPVAATKKVSFGPGKPRESKKLKIEQIEIKSRRSGVADNLPQTREMLELKRIEYPKISEFIYAIAKENNLGFSEVQLIGIFDPVPLHLASGLVLDPVSGKLRFFARANPRAERRFARVAYARLRSTGAIVQSVFPVT